MLRLLNLLRRRRDGLERDLDRELQFHLDRRTEELITGGLSEPEARRQANLELGGLAQVQEAVRDTWSWQWLDALMCDVRVGIRSLAAARGFTLGAGAVLAVTIGANAAIFSVVSTVLLQPLPYPEAARLVAIETLWTNTGQNSENVSGPDFLDWQERNGVFETMAVHYGSTDTPVVVGDRAVFANDQFVSGDFFSVFGQTASAGRLLGKDDVPVSGALPTSAVVAHAWALTHFGSAQAALGKTIVDYGYPMTIVGVASPGFRYPAATDIWVAWSVSAEAPRTLHNFQAVGRLVSWVGRLRAEAEMRAIADNLARQYPENRLKSVSLVPLQERLTGGIRGTLWALMAGVGVLWLLACVNIASLLLARATSRHREMALRAALGAGRGRVVRQLLIESGLLATGAAPAGLLLAWILMRGVVALSPEDLLRIDAVRMDPTVLGFAIGLTLLSALLFGLVPALETSRADLSSALKQGGPKATSSRTSARIRSGLVIAEVALAAVLLATAGLLARSFQALQHVELGFTTDRVLVAYTEYAVEDAEDIQRRTRFYVDLLDRLRAVPGVSAAAGVAYLGMGREPRTPRDYFVEGRPEGQPGERPQAEFHAVTPDYFNTLEIPVLAGRDFVDADTPESPPVAIISRTLARTAFPGESPIGKRVRTGTSSRAPWMEIVGIVGDTRWQDPGRPAEPVIYAAATQGQGNSPSILARTSLDEGSLAGIIRGLLKEADPTVPVEFETMDEMFDHALRYPRFRTLIMGLFAGVAAVLAAVGVFSVLAYVVGQRTRELAVRRALGAPAFHVVGLILGHGLRLVAIGLVAGVSGAVGVAGLLTGLLFEVSPWDVGTYLGTIGLLGIAGLLATLVPAIRAVTIAPVIALQQE